MIPMHANPLTWPTAPRLHRAALSLFALLAVAGCHHATAPSFSDVVGSYTADVLISQPNTDSFMRAVPFTFRSGRLEADHMVGNRRVFAILGRR